MKNLREVHVRWDFARRQWAVEEYPTGDHLEPIYVEHRWLKWVAVWVARGAAKNGSPCELFIHGRNGRIQDRSTYPPSADPRGRG